MPNRHYVSFGSGNRGWRSALKRLRREIERLDSKARIWFFDETTIGEDIDGLSIPFSAFAKRHPRGFGLWLWKPWVILQVLNQANEGDYVFYLDAGCTVHSSLASRERYRFYLEHLQNHGSLFFQMNLAERCWTKRAVVEYFQLDQSELDSGQISATVHGYVANENSRRLVRDWLRFCTLDEGRLLWDSDSRVLEDHRFIEHRHDQSLLSCLIKREANVALPDETFFHPKWNRDGKCFPFWGTRKRSGLPSWLGYYAPIAVVIGRLERHFGWKIQA